MNSLYTFVAVLAAIVLISSTAATIQQQASGIIVNWREEFRVLTDEFEDAVSDATDQENLLTLPAYKSWLMITKLILPRFSKILDLSENDMN